LGIVLGQAFLMWTHRRQAAGKTPLLALELIDSLRERAAVYALFAVVALGAALNFSIPLYIQIVRERSQATSQRARARNRPDSRLRDTLRYAES
jgi:hypothetical protein